MLKIQNLTKSFGGHTLFENISLQMNSGERLGLVGRNGHGKTTLFRMILGEERADSGQIILPDYYRIGYLSQHLHFEQPTILEEACLGLPEEERDQSYRAEKILFGLGFTKADLDRSPQEFSGGYQIRLNLAKLLISEPNLLLLDEPTNYLDILSIRWIVRFLRNWRSELIIISHDRDFMDSVTTHTAILHRQKLKKVLGNTTKLYTQIEQEEEIYEKTRLNEAQQRKQVEAFIDRFRATANKAAAVQSRIKQLDKLPTKEKLLNVANLDFRFQETRFEAQTCLEAQDISFGYDEANLLIEKLSFLVKSKERIAIIGKNGKGKSTLLRIVAGEISPLEGNLRIHPTLQIGYFGQTNLQRLHLQNTIEEEITQSNPALSRTSVRSICGAMMFSGAQAEKRISVLSGGERSRVLLGKILATPSNLILLDEPTNHLDMESIESLIESIEVFSGAVLIVTHNEELLRRIPQKLIIFDSDRVRFFPGTYDEFLEQIGWEEEKNQGISTRNASEKKENKNPNKKEARRKRAELISERSTQLNPLKNKIQKLEQQIEEAEKLLSTENEKLSELMQGNASDKLAEATKNIGRLQKNRDQLYETLESAISEKEKIEAQYAAKLEEVSG